MKAVQRINLKSNVKLKKKKDDDRMFQLLKEVYDIILCHVREFLMAKTVHGRKGGSGRQ
jgi:hypothetical protein